MNFIKSLLIRLVVASCSNTYRRSFPESGIYYFQTETKTREKKNVCVVEVVESFRLINLKFNLTLTYFISYFLESIK